MKSIVYARQFKKDHKRAIKRGYDLDKLKFVLGLLVQNKDLPHSYRVHKLSGNYEGLWECHLEPDWLLIYEYTSKELRLRRMGTHADLFD